MPIAAPLAPIGILSARTLGPDDRTALLAGADQSLKHDATLLGYLGSGTTLFAIMEFTRDVIGTAFGVSGGSAVRTDGTYYWRGDAAEYVANYGVRPSTAFLAHVEQQREPTPITSEEFLQLDAAMYTYVRSGPDPVRSG